MAQQIIRSIGSDGKEVLSNILDKDTGKLIEFKEVSEYYDGTPMTDDKLDIERYLYIKNNGKYYLRVLDNPDKFLEKDTMLDMRNISNTEILLLKMGYYKGVTLNGYYEKGDTPSSIRYYISNRIEEDNSANIIIINDNIILEHKFIGNNINISYFGATGRDMDEYSNIQKAIDYICNYFVIFNSNATLEFSFGKVYKVSKPILLSGNRWNINGNNCTIVKTTNDLTEEDIPITPAIAGNVSPKIINSIFLTKHRVTYANLRDFKLEGIPGTSNPTGIYFIGSQNQIKNIDGNYLNNGIHIPAMWVSSLENIVFRNCTGISIYFDDNRSDTSNSQTGTSITFKNVTSFDSGINGFKIQRLFYSQMINCTSDRAIDSHFIFHGCYGMVGQIGFERKIGNDVPQVNISSCRHNYFTIDTYEDVLFESPVFNIAGEGKVVLAGRLRSNNTKYIKASAKAIVDATNLYFNPINGQDQNDERFEALDTSYIKIQSNESEFRDQVINKLYYNGGVKYRNITGDLKARNTGSGGRDIIYGNNSLKIVYNVSDFSTTWENKIKIPISDMNKVFDINTGIGNFQYYKIIISERDNISSDNFMIINNNEIIDCGNNGEYNNISGTTPIKVQIDSITIVGDNIEILLDPSGGSRQSISATIIKINK